MNIFVLDSEPELAAEYLCDKHVVKMCLETTQILATVSNRYGVSTKYKPTHKNHPCVRWAGDYQGNYDWVRRHGLALFLQYKLRYGKDHKSYPVYVDIVASMPRIISGSSEYVQCMPDKYRQLDPVRAYRAYYIGKKSRFATWKNNIPYWWRVNEKD